MSIMSELDRALREHERVLYGDGPKPASVDAGRPARMGFSAAWYARHLVDETLDQTVAREIADRDQADEAEARMLWRLANGY